MTKKKLNKGDRKMTKLDLRQSAENAERTVLLSCGILETGSSRAAPSIAISRFLISACERKCVKTLK